MTNFESLIDNYYKIDNDETVQFADGRELVIAGKGHITLRITGNESITVPAFHIPKLGSSLLSVNDLTSQGYQVIFHKGLASIMKPDGETLTTVHRAHDRVFNLKILTSPSPCLAVRPKSFTIMELHKRMGHIRFYILRQMIRNGYFKGLSIDTKYEDECRTCRMCKATSVPHATVAEQKANSVGEFVIVDLFDLKENKHST